MRRYEIQPILDVSKLPDFHYLPYDSAKQLSAEFEGNRGKPQWLTVPDFFLPSKNINNIVENRPEVVQDSTSLRLLCDMVGVSTEEALSYVHQKEEKELVRSGRKDMFRARR